MRQSLARWIGDADALRNLEDFQVIQAETSYGHIRARAGDYFLSLVGELFDRMRDGYSDATHWARLGNALALFAEGRVEHLQAVGVSANETAFFAAAAFYYGGFPASAYLTVRELQPTTNDEIPLACFDLLARPSDIRSRLFRSLLVALRRGDLEFIEQAATSIADAAKDALNVGPTEWIHARLLQQLLARFRSTNIRAVLPNGNTGFWTPLVSSFLNRKPPIWEFFPSQIDAIRMGLLQRSESFSLQMPTGAGKTALCETLIYWHLKSDEDNIAILLVPYRSLASELRNSLVKHLNQMGISTRCAYGGTVPTGDEVQGLDNVRAMVATPETLSGLLSMDVNFIRRISLVICDEGHLLDAGERGVGLELLLARLRAREGGQPRFIFVSAIVPNIEEINAWLGGTQDSVVRSNYRPALAEFAMLHGQGTGQSLTVALDMHSHEAPPIRYSVDGFLSRADFQWINPETGRFNTYAFSSVKTQAIATARKALSVGTVAVFAANKPGDQGAIGLAEELIKQLSCQLNLPEPISFANATKVAAASEYLKNEYGTDWVGTRAFAVGAVLHHGDIPQETREVLESLLRHENVKLAICTSTLAEGVNLPIRTLVLYSIQRVNKYGQQEAMLGRDIKNLVGRAGRAGATTKGLVICANERQWHLVRRVARQTPDEPVKGALFQLLEDLRAGLARHGRQLTNALLENTPQLHTLIDGIDSTLIDLSAEEIGEENLVRLGIQVVEQTFASRQLDVKSKRLLESVFELRARRVASVYNSGRLEWIRETGTRPRMLDAVENGLLPTEVAWDEITDPVDPIIVTTLLDWAWQRRELELALRIAYRLDNSIDIESIRGSFFELVSQWLSGCRYIVMAERSNLPMDVMLGIHTGVITFVLQTLVDQGIALLAKLLESQGRTISQAVTQFPDHLRFGVPTATARILATGGVRHRHAAVKLGASLEHVWIPGEDKLTTFLSARDMLIEAWDEWKVRLGHLVAHNTKSDIISVTNA